MSSERYAVIALSFLMFLFSSDYLIAGKFNRQLSIGDQSPEWKGLPGVDDRLHGLKDHRSKFLVVVFFANHCPVAAAYEERLIKLAEENQTRSVEFVAISVSHHESDRLAKMKDRARDSKFPFSYLRDDSQEIGRRFGATATPQVFVLDSNRKVAYMGTIDDNWRNASKVESHYLRAALDAIIAEQPIEIRETKPVGCEIEYSARGTVKE